MSPQLSCGDTWNIWPWLTGSSLCIRKIQIFCNGEINERIFSNPTPDDIKKWAVMHVSRWIPRWLSRGFFWSRWRGNRSRHSRVMHNPQFFLVRGPWLMRYREILQQEGYWLDLLVVYWWVLCFGRDVRYGRTWCQRWSGTRLLDHGHGAKWSLRQDGGSPEPSGQCAGRSCVFVYVYVGKCHHHNPLSSSSPSPSSSSSSSAAASSSSTIS